MTKPNVIFNEALNFIEKKHKQPFFCYISTNAPHSPFNVEPCYRDIYLGKHTDSEPYARFLGMISNIDENFGRLREKLRQLGIEDNTILIFMSDNGQTYSDRALKVYNSGMRGMKGSPYEGGHRVPFLLRWPAGGLGKPQSVDSLAAYIDFMPTILDLCNIETPEDGRFHGETLVPLLRGDVSAHWHERIMVTDTQRVAYPLKWRLSCVMKGMWRLVNRYELYDLHKDPAQCRNVADQHPEILKELQNAYEHWWELCSEQIEDDIPISVGSEAQPETTLRTQDMFSEKSDVVWSQQQVRCGKSCQGYWEIFAERDGLYEFEMRRWPQEAGHLLKAGIEGDDVPYREDGIEPDTERCYSGGEALNFDTATLKLSGLPRQELDIGKDDEQVTFRMKLKRGSYHLRADFSGAGGEHMAAYYVYVRCPDGK